MRPRRIQSTGSGDKVMADSHARHIAAGRKWPVIRHLKSA
jgi:ribosomal protein L35